MLSLRFILMGLLLTGAARAEEIAADKLIPTRQRGFAIPFEVPAAAKLQRESAQVELYVSTDQGKTWRHAATTRPNFNHEPADGQFPFRAADDGEYWFAVRTLDANTDIAAKPDYQPGLKVLVDTVSPKLEGEAWRDRTGGVTAWWQASDSDLDAATLKIEYQATAEGTWQVLAVDPPSATNSKTRVIGEKTWFPSEGETGTVRISVADGAGNTNVVQFPVRRDGPPAKRSPADSLPPSIADSIHDSRRESNYVTSRGNQVWEPDDRTPMKSAPRSEYQSSLPSNPAQEPPAEEARAPWRTTGGQSEREKPLGESFAESSPAKEIRPASTRKALVGSKLNFDVLPPHERPRMVNSTSFAIEYEIDSPGASGIARIELWGTKDGGKNWSLFCTDEEHQSPVKVVVDEEGIYGFNIVVVSRGGAPAVPPQAGELPELWVGVDQTPPNVKLLPIELSDDAAAVTIRWQADDDMLDVRPVRLEYGESANGPWSPIAVDLPNRGEYVWKLDEKRPDAAFIRITVRDEAGNTGTQDSVAPITLNRERPLAHIRTVRPISK